MRLCSNTQNTHRTLERCHFTRLAQSSKQSTETDKFAQSFLGFTLQGHQRHHSLKPAQPTILLNISQQAGHFVLERRGHYLVLGFQAYCQQSSSAQQSSSNSNPLRYLTLSRTCLHFLSITLNISFYLILILYSFERCYNLPPFEGNLP